MSTTPRNTKHINTQKYCINQVKVLQRANKRQNGQETPQDRRMPGISSPFWFEMKYNIYK